MEKLTVTFIKLKRMNEKNIVKFYCNLKDSGNNFWTNIYSLKPLEMLKNLEAKGSLIHLKKNALVVIEKQRLINRAYFLLEACNDSMDVFHNIELDTLIFDLIEDKRNRHFIESLPLYGFKLYASLNRMSQKLDNSFEIDSDKIEYANIQDDDQIYSLYEKNFDHSVDRIPCLGEIREKIFNSMIICTKDGGTISSFASISISPGVATLNHILVRPEFRGRGEGESLFRNFLWLASKSKAVRLWVVPGNIPAISLYQKYNFQFDGLKNLVYKYEPKDITNT